jgi:hypothetical protein
VSGQLDLRVQHLGLTTTREEVFEFVFLRIGDYPQTCFSFGDIDLGNKGCAAMAAAVREDLKAVAEDKSKRSTAPNSLNWRRTCPGNSGDRGYGDCMNKSECGCSSNDVGMSGHLTPEQKTMLRKADHLKLDNLLHSLSWRLPDWLFKWDHSYLLQSRQLRLIVLPHPDYQVRPTSLEDIGVFERANVDPELIACRLRRGDHCVMVLKNDQLIAWSWTAIGRLLLKLDGAFFDTGEDGFFIYDVYTAPAERLKGLIMNCYELQLNHYRRTGRENIYSAISVLNTNALSTHFRMGFTAIGEIRGLKF